MKQSLQLKLGQNLTMTPQLQQAIRLLQLSTLDLQQEIQSIIETNPMLESSEDGNSGTEPENSADSTHEDQTPSENDELPPDENLDDSYEHTQVDYAEDNSLTNANESQSLNEPEETGSDWQDNIPNELPIDTKWDDVYSSTPISNNLNSNLEFK